MVELQLESRDQMVSEGAIDAVSRDGSVLLRNRERCRLREGESTAKIAASGGRSSRCAGAKAEGDRKEQAGDGDGGRTIDGGRCEKKGSVSRWPAGVRGLKEKDFRRKRGRFRHEFLADVPKSVKNDARRGSDSAPLATTNRDPD